MPKHKTSRNRNHNFSPLRPRLFAPRFGSILLYIRSHCLPDRLERHNASGRYLWHRSSGHCKGASKLTIHLTSMANRNHKNTKCLILYIANNSIVPYPVAPVHTKLRTNQCLAIGTWIIQDSQTLPKKSDNAFCFTFVKLRQNLGS